jgi:hypothetical protein
LTLAPAFLRGAGRGVSAFRIKGIGRLEVGLPALDDGEHRIQCLDRREGAARKALGKLDGREVADLQESPR